VVDEADVARIFNPRGDRLLLARFGRATARSGGRPQPWGLRIVAGRRPAATFRSASTRGRSAPSACWPRRTGGAPASLRLQRGHVASRGAGTSKAVISSRVRVVRAARRVSRGGRSPSRSGAPDLGIVHLRASLPLRLGELPLAQSSRFPRSAMARAHWRPSRLADRRRREPVLDGVGGEVARLAFELLERGGRILSFALASGPWSTSRRTRRASRRDRAAPVARDARRAPRLHRARAGRGRGPGRRAVIGRRSPA
jgi:hypothetical protein